MAVDRLGRSSHEIQLEERAFLTYKPKSYTGTGSFQPIGIDLTLGAAAGGTTGKFLSPIMGNVLGENLTKAGNYIGGLIGHYNVSGTNATTYPSGAVLGGIGDGTTTAKGAFIAYIDGDSAQTNAGAAFLVMHNNSTAGSGFSYGLDLYGAARDGYSAVAFLSADIRFSNGQGLVALTTAITANVTTTSAAAGTKAITSNATGRASIFVSDGSKWQYLTNA